MMPYKYEVTLIMKSSNLSALELSIMRKQRPQEPPSSMSKSRREPIQYQFWHMIGCGTIVGYITRRNDVAYFEESGGASKTIGRRRRTEMRDQHTIAHLTLLRKNNEMCEFSITSKCTNFLDRVGFSGIVVHLGDESHQICDEMK